MFKKFDPKESVSGQTQAKSSVQRAIRTKLAEQYPKIEPYLDDLIPKKSPLVIVKCQDRIQVLTVNGRPLFFNHFDGPWMPVLRILHQYPFIMPALQVDRGAIKFILSSAHIMCPGLTSAGAWMPADSEGLPAESPVAIFAEGKQLPLAIGWLKMSTSDIRKINKNIGVENMHHLGDGLWKTTELH
ncbi:translation machinery-associated protein 20 [Blastocladiella emersonii ATCC 22665]|nr:translation machinery-associated protein 20 [Blastocladiella emersonii ATCC 22665]